MLVATARGVIVHDGKLLGVQQKGHKFWCLPGGKLDPHESATHALKRELVEELGIEPEIGELLYIQQYTESDGRDFIEFFFRVNNPQDYLVIDTSTTTHGEIELDAIKFLDPRVEDVLPKFLSAEADDYVSGTFTTRLRVQE